MTIQPSGVYKDILDRYSAIGMDGASLWNSFLTTSGITFNFDLSSNRSKVEELATLALSQLYQSINPLYVTILQNSSASAVQQSALWITFLSRQPASFDPTTDASKAGALLKLAQESSFFSTGALSPNEITKRWLMTETFNEILKMLATIQDTISAQANKLVFYAKWQQAYTKMITASPIYTGSTSDAMKANTTDPTKFTFGYNNISVDSIASYLAQTPSSTTEFSLSTPSGTAGDSLVMKASYTSNTEGQVVISYSGSQSPVTVSAQSLQFSASDSFEQRKTAWSNALMNSLTKSNYSGSLSPLVSITGQFNSATNNYSFTTTNSTSIPPTSTSTVPGFSIPWQFKSPFSTTTTNKDEQTANSLAAQSRDSQNSLLQQYAQTSTARRQSIQSAQQELNANMGQTQNALSKQSNVLTNIIKTMQDIMSAIAKTQ